MYRGNGLFIFSISVILPFIHMDFLNAQEESTISISDISAAEKIIGLSFDQNDRDSLREDLEEQLEAYRTIHDISIGNEVPPSIQFTPLPNGFNAKGSPTSISFIGRLFDEGKLLAFAKLYQDVTMHHKKHPPLFVPKR